MDALPLLATMTKRRTLYCSFCRKDERHVKKLVAGPGVYICDVCIETCRKFARGEPAPQFVGWDALSDELVLATLAPSAAAVDSARDALQDDVERLRKRGVSWEKIGAALGMSRQAAWERFG
jgi:hypothetical protein